MPALLVVLTVVSTFRLTLAVTTDRLTQTVRRKIAGWEPVEPDETWEGEGADIDLHHIDCARRPKLAYLVKCDWCSSFWISWVPATLAVLWPTNRAVWIVVLALSGSAVAGVAATVLAVAVALPRLIDAARDRLDGPCP